MVHFLAGAVALAYSLQVTRAVSEWGQCGGINYTGAACDSGLICVEQNPYYYQCLPGSTSITPPLTTSSVHTSSTTSSKASSTSTVKTSSSTKSTSTSSLSSKTTSTSSKPTTTSTITSQVISPTTTATSTYTGTLPIGTLSPTGLAAAAKKKNKYIGSSYDNVDIANTTYTQLVLSQVNAMTPENSMKWDSLEQTQGAFNTSLWADRVVNITQLNHLYLRGHTLVWYSQLPAWVTSGGFSNASLIAVMENHITNVMARWKGEIYIWDVVNEPLNDDGTLRASIFYTTIGEYYIDMAFNTAKATDSNAILAVNDYNIEGSGAKSTGMISLVSRVKARGVPIEQIGIQGHLIVGEVPTTMTANWNAFVALGVSIAVTELDIRMPTPASTANLAQQATDYTTVVNTCLGITQCLGITFWGLSDAFSWIPSTFSGYGAATPYDEAFNPKPAYTAILAALNA